MTTPPSSQPFQPNLRPGERVLWTGAPKQGLYLQAKDAYMIPFSIVWASIAFLWEITAVRNGGPALFIIWGIPFVITGIYIIIGRFFVDARIRKNTSYVLTNERVIILSGLRNWRVTSLPLDSLSSVSLKERVDGSGTIALGSHAGENTPARANSGYFRTGPSASPEFERIGNASFVHGLVLDARRLS